MEVSHQTHSRSGGYRVVFEFVVGTLARGGDKSTRRTRTLVGSFGFFTATALSPNLPRNTALAGPSWIGKRFAANSCLGTARLTRSDLQQSRKHAVHPSAPSTAAGTGPSVGTAGGDIVARRWMRERPERSVPTPGKTCAFRVAAGQCGRIRSVFLRLRSFPRAGGSRRAPGRGRADPAHAPSASPRADGLQHAAATDV